MQFIIVMHYNFWLDSSHSDTVTPFPTPVVSGQLNKEPANICH